MTFGISRLEGMPQSEREELARSVQLLLLWVAASDGTVDDAEREFLADQFPGPEGQSTDELLKTVRAGDRKAMDAALHRLADESRELRTAFLDLAITMSMADHRMANSENSALHTYADRLNLGEAILERRFQAICGAKLGQPAESDGGDGPSVSTARSAPRMTVEQARAILGVGAGARRDDIERNYRNLSEIFSVDRVAAMGGAAVAVAKDRSEKIEEAYRVLKS